MIKILYINYVIILGGELSHLFEAMSISKVIKSEKSRHRFPS